MKEKITEFEGYLSGDGECFCLDQLADFDFSEDSDRRDKETSYPGSWFPKNDWNKKYKIKIIIQIEELPK